MSREEGFRVHTVDVMRMVETITPSGATRKEWKLLAAAVPCRAVNMQGGSRSLEFAQRGFKRPWLFLFEDNPGIGPAVNRLGYTDQSGVYHQVDVVQFRAANDGGGNAQYWVAEGDEVTQTPATR